MHISMLSDVNVGRDNVMMKGSNSNGNPENSNACLQKELELLLLQQHQQQNRNYNLERERDLIFRSGSAPPTVEGALRAAGSLFRNPDFPQVENNGNGACSGSAANVNDRILMEEEIRSHPAYLEYYYSHENLNPRLPPPLLSKEDWRVAQRVRAASSGFGGIGDWRNKNLMDGGGSMSLFSMQPRLSLPRAEDELMELRKAAMRNLSRKNSSEMLDRASPGPSAAPSPGMGVRRKSFADILQEGLGQPGTSSGRLSRPASHNSISDILDSTGISNMHSAEMQIKAEPLDSLHPNIPNLGTTHSNSLASSSLMRSRNPESHLVDRNPGAGFPSIGNGYYLPDKKDNACPDILKGSSPCMTDINDIATSLSGLTMSKDQLPGETSFLKSPLQMGMPAGHRQNMQHQQFIENSGLQKLAASVNYADLGRENGVGRDPNISNSFMDERVNFPRRTSSSTNLHLQFNPDEFSGTDGFRMQNQGNNYHGMNISGNFPNGYYSSQKPGKMLNNYLHSGPVLVNGPANGRNSRSNQTGSELHFPFIEPQQVQYLQRIFNFGQNAEGFSGSSSQVRCAAGTLQGYGDLKTFEKAVLDALLVQQKQQYQSGFLHKSGSINHQYHGSPVFGPFTPYQGKQMANSTQSTVPSRPVFQNERNSNVSLTTRSSKGVPVGSWHPDSGKNVEQKFESLLEALKTNKAKSLELSDVLNHVIEFSTDQYGSRFIQQKLESASTEEKMKIFPEIIPNARSLMTDVFGNYVIQKFFEHGIESQRKELASQLIGHVLPLSLQMYGCRVIQKALEVLDVEWQTQIVAELGGSVMKCVRDQNGNHVIQKCIECVPQDRIQFIISSFVGQVVALSTHPYGCRVIQRVLEHCDDPNTQQMIMDEIMQSVCTLSQDQYGNYVIQHVLQHGKPHERSAIISKLAGQIVKMSQQKFASNVVEKCLTFGGPEERQLLVNEMLGSTDENEPLQAMMKDPFGNYVVQKVLETCNDESRELILSRIKVHLTALKKYTYGKHIVSRVEKLIATGERHIGVSSKSCK